MNTARSDRWFFSWVIVKPPHHIFEQRADGVSVHACKHTFLSFSLYLLSPTLIFFSRPPYVRVTHAAASVPYLRIRNNKCNTTWMERHPRATPTQPAWNSNITEQCGRGRPSVDIAYSRVHRVQLYRVYRFVHIPNTLYTHTHTHTRARARTYAHTYAAARCVLNAMPPHAPL